MDRQYYEELVRTDTSLPLYACATCGRKFLKELQVVTVTRYGKPVMTILAAHTYKALQKTIEKLQAEVDGLLETLEILKDEETMAAFHRGVEDIKAGRVIPWEEVKKELELE